MYGIFKFLILQVLYCVDVSCTGSPYGCVILFPEFHTDVALSTFENFLFDLSFPRNFHFEKLPKRIERPSMNF